MEFNVRIGHNTYSLSPEVGLDQNLLFLNPLPDDNAFADYYSLGDYQFLFQNGDRDGAVWQRLYLPGVFLLRINALHFNVFGIPRNMLDYALRGNIFIGLTWSRLVEVLSSPLTLLTGNCLGFLPYFRITALTNTTPAKEIGRAADRPICYPYLCLCFSSCTVSSSISSSPRPTPSSSPCWSPH
jgi:hypothetical protein